MVEPHGPRTGSRLAERASRACRPGLAVLMTFAVAVAASACGGDDPAPQGSATDPVERVVVDAPDGDFDAEAVYRHAAPGVVTIRSVFDAESSTPTGPVQGLGSGF